jgi:hypothetical protein
MHKNKTIFFSPANSLELHTLPDQVESSAIKAPCDQVDAILPEGRWKDYFGRLLMQKGLSMEMLSDKSVNFSDSIDQHARWVFKHIYSYPYVDPVELAHFEERSGRIARIVHGLMHVCRAAFYVPVLANLYRKYEDADALRLTADEIKLLQIAVLFHDSARDNEEDDNTDHDSALILYFYLTKILNLSEQTAAVFAEAVMNKDPRKEAYFVIINLESATTFWQATAPRETKSIYQKIIHDADCLDIIRARDHFNAEYLAFYQDFVKRRRDSRALDEIAILITEVRSLIARQGDARFHVHFETKAKYEHENGYVLIASDIILRSYPVLYQLHAGACLLSRDALRELRLVDVKPFDPSLGLTTQNMQALIWEGKVFARGISTPSALRIKPLRQGGVETLAQVELRKISRRKGVPTQSSKSDRAEKDGNPYRSMSMLGFGATVFSNAGFLVTHPETKRIQGVSLVDCDSSFGKKLHLRSSAVLTEAEVIHSLAQLIIELKKGGSSIRYDGYAYRHAEILYHVNDYQAIYFTQDPSLGNTNVYGDTEITHPNAPILEAIYLQKEYQHTFGKTLPIFKYSGVHNQIALISELSDDEIIALWVEMCEQFLLMDFASIAFEPFEDLSLDAIKTLSMYDKHKSYIDYLGINSPADRSYERPLQIKLDEVLARTKQRAISCHREMVILAIQHSTSSLLSDDCFFSLLRDVELLGQAKCFFQKATAFVEEQSVALLFEQNLPNNALCNDNPFPTQMTFTEYFISELFEPCPKSPTSIEDRKYLYHLPILRAFVLARKGGFIHDLQVIKAKVHDFINTLLREAEWECTNLLSQDSEEGSKGLGCFELGIKAVRLEEWHHQLRCLINFIATFGFLADFKRILQDHIVHLILSVTTLVRRFPLPKIEIAHYLSFIDYLERNHLAAPALKRRVAVLIDKLVEFPPLCAEGAYVYLSWYLRLVRWVDVSTGMPKAIFKNLLRAHGADFCLPYERLCIEVSHTAILEDEGVFYATVSGIDVLRQPDCQLDRALQNYNQLLTHLQTAMPLKVFNAKQWELVCLKTNEMCKEIIAKVFAVSFMDTPIKKLECLLFLIEKYLSIEKVVVKDGALSVFAQALIECLLDIPDDKRPHLKVRIENVFKALEIEPYMLQWISCAC